ncbi:metal-dependent hydrolase [Streptomyces gilvus]|uniref:metal-dependent hydrolase n=1 Tax=Streptomyces gilvus TaxID=2920937 RepID=UPI001F0DDD3F|nr:metal-dependent hydrolase [Streptomyces sp. CME 23]MCH5672667.1 metal-dependent hydrolase [Streptomyces sp. CME 23]
MSAPIAPRRVSFDWSRTPLHWIPGEPTATRVINVLHLVLPAGERWFVKGFKEGLPLAGDPELLADVKGFMGQEATHSEQHAYVLDHLAAQRLETAHFTWYVDFLFERLLGERPPLHAPLPAREWLRFRLAVVAAIEQFTAVLGDRILAVGYSLAEHDKAVRKGLLPAWKDLGAAIPRYVRRSYHPSQEGSLSRAVAYLCSSPAARRAA